MKVLEQSNEYNCGVYALHFLLGLNGVNVEPSELEKLTGTTEKDGTSHEGIKKGAKHFNFKWVEWNNAHISSLPEFLPAIINYQYCDEYGCDGHYSVVIGEYDDTFTIYNPATGEIELLPFKELEKKWYSDRYGKGWLLHISKI